MTGRTAWESIDNCLNYGAERFVAQGEDLLRRCDIFLGLDPDIEANARKERLDEVLTLGVLKKTLPAKALDFYARNAATKRLVNRGVIKRQRNKWKILKDV